MYMIQGFDQICVPFSLFHFLPWPPCFFLPHSAFLCVSDFCMCMDVGSSAVAGVVFQGYIPGGNFFSFPCSYRFLVIEFWGREFTSLSHVHAGILADLISCRHSVVSSCPGNNGHCWCRLLISLTIFAPLSYPVITEPWIQGLWETFGYVPSTSNDCNSYNILYHTVNNIVLSKGIHQLPWHKLQL